MSRSTLLSSRFAFATVIVAISFCLVTASRAQDSAQSEIRITRGEAVRISNIDDWLIGVFTANDSINTIQYNWDAECVYTTTGSYRVEVTSANGGSQLRLESSAGDQMNYTLYAYFRRGNNYLMRGYTTPVITIDNLSGSTSPTCADEPVTGVNLWFAALVRPADFNPAPPGIYQDLATLTVSPE